LSKKTDHTFPEPRFLPERVSFTNAAIQSPCQSLFRGGIVLAGTPWRRKD
jgi:hypothetical protein